MSRLCGQLCRTLEGNTMALVQARRNAKRASLELVPSSPVDHMRMDDARRVTEVIAVLLPERERMMDDFVGKFDALVWLELATSNKQEMSIEEQQRYRDEYPLFRDTLQCTKDVLVNLCAPVSAQRPVLQAWVSELAAPRSGSGQATVDMHPLPGRWNEMEILSKSCRAATVGLWQMRCFA